MVWARTYIYFGIVNELKVPILHVVPGIKNEYYVKL